MSDILSPENRILKNGMPVFSVSLRSVSHFFGAVPALGNINITFNKGDCAVIKGHNGAGKSTLLYLLSTLLKPTFGSMLINGSTVQNIKVRTAIGFLSHKPMLYPDLTAAQNLKMYAGLYGVNPEDSADELRERFDLSDFFDDRSVGVLSKGELQKVAVARAFAGNPSLLLLDEPDAGLDADAVLRLEHVLKDYLGQGGICLFSSHNDHLAAQIASREVVLSGGVIVKDDVWSARAGEDG